MADEIKRLKQDIQKQTAYTEGIFQGDITIKTLFESLAEAIIVVNDQGRIIHTNDRFVSLFGYSKEEVNGEAIDIFLLPETKKRHGNHILSFFKNPKIRPMGSGFELIAITKNHDKLNVEISLSYLNTISGTLGLAFISDITDRKKAEKDLLEKNKALDAYAHTITHDLKSSLNNIIGFSELLLVDKSINEKKRVELLEYIWTGGIKMNDVIDAILLMAKVDKNEVERTPLEMDIIIQDVLARQNLNIQSKKASITVRNQPNLKHALGYAPWVEEVVYNLIGNAIKHGGESPEIVIGSYEDNNYTCYFVQNKGIPISAEKIFELNRNIDKIKIESTSGFGLSIVYRILEKLDGKLLIESSEKDGTTFSFYLPNK